MIVELNVILIFSFSTWFAKWFYIMLVWGLKGVIMNGRVYLLIIILFTILMVVFIYFIIQNQRLYAI